uniref:BSD domain-containing protein n=1 Tax=Davidia involucrata TaxID=16924 RepID=A0A5B6YIF3_DAVIN
MSWLARSIANSLKLDDDDDDNDDNNPNNINAKDEQHHQSDPPSPSTPERGVKEDLSEITKTLTRQFWGVASFLAPPPSSEPSSPAEVSDSNPNQPSDPELSDSSGIAGISSDFAEIGGKFRRGFSKLSNNVAVSEITKIASNFLQLGSEQEGYDSAGGAVGVTEEVVAFVRDIAMHPETWLDFPLPDDEDDYEFDMSDAQQEHALAVERLAPRLAALRIELCPGYMSEDCFWKIYFVLLHPRLNKHDAELLSTPQIVKARALLTQELQNQTKAKPEQDWSGRGTSNLKDSDSPHEVCLSVPSNSQSESAQSEYMPLEKSAIKSATSTVATNFETEKLPILSTEVQTIDKSVIEEGPVKWTNAQNLYSGSSSRVLEDKYEDDGDDWLKEESSEIVGGGGTTISIENEEDVSFSDLEEEDGDVSTSYKKVTYGSDSSTKDSRDWVQLSRSSADSSKDINAVTVERAGSEQVSAHNPETKESNDWLNVDDIDVV